MELLEQQHPFIFALPSKLSRNVFPHFTLTSPILSMYVIDMERFFTYFHPIIQQWDLCFFILLPYIGLRNSMTCFKTTASPQQNNA